MSPSDLENVGLKEYEDLSVILYALCIRCLSLWCCFACFCFSILYFVCALSEGCGMIILRSNQKSSIKMCMFSCFFSSFKWNC